MGLKIYGHPGCTTVKKAVDWARDNALDAEYSHFGQVEELDIEIRAWVAAAGIDSVFNAKAQTLKKMDKDIQAAIQESDESRIRAMVDDPRLIKRPIGTNGQSVLTGFKPDEWAAAFC